MNYQQQLIQKLSSREAVLGVVGLGYVGLPLIDAYARAGYRVVGLDVDQSKIDLLNGGSSYLQHIDANGLIESIKKNIATVTTDFARANECDAIILCVPTPLDEHREPDLSFVIGSVESILPYLRSGQVVSLESTTYPGTTNEVLRPIIEKSDFSFGEDIFLVYSPEREDPGNKVFNTTTIPKLVSGSTKPCLEVAMALYQHVVEELIPVSSTEVAEMAKILENTFRAVNIALVNELKVVAEKMGVDIFEVIKAAATKPFGYTAFYPGPGLGGHCIPIDPFYLTWKAREYEVTTRFIELAGEVNTKMPDYVVDRIGYALNGEAKSINQSRILILGVSYKKNVDDMRESPSLVIIEKLQDLGANIDYCDPYVKTLPKTRKHDLNLESIVLSAESLPGYDCVVVCTDHDSLEWDLIEKHAKLIVDARGRYTPDNQRIHRA